MSIHNARLASKDEEVTLLYVGGEVRKKSPMISSSGVVDTNLSGNIFIKE